jgi:hypothetical protein
MRLILHSKVYSDIDKIMEYYELLQTLRMSSMWSYGISSWRRWRGPNPFRVESTTSAESTFSGFPIIFYFASWATQFVFSLSGITEEIPLWGSDAYEVA